MIPPPAQQFLAGRMGATVQSVALSHAPFMSQPRAVADIIAAAADSLAIKAEVSDNAEIVMAG